MKAIAILLLAILPAVFGFGAASLRGCSATTTYNSGAGVSATASCTNSGGQASGSWSRTATTLTNTDSGSVTFYVNGTFETNCPVYSASSGLGNNNPPVASWAVWRTDVNPAVKVNGIGGAAAAGKYDMSSFISTVAGVTRTYPANAQFQLRVSISSGSSSCWGKIYGASLIVNQPAK